MRYLQSTLACLLLQFSAAVLSAEPDEDAAAAAAMLEEEAALEASASAEQGTPQAAAGSSTTPRTGTQPGGDFVPSVQISEDLSVSFPVDI
jgi:hypothetical protein